MVVGKGRANTPTLKIKWIHHRVSPHRLAEQPHRLGAHSPHHIAWRSRLPCETFLRCLATCIQKTMNISTKLGIIFALFAAAFYQGILKSTLFVTLGIGREVQPISDFPAYQCRRIHDPNLQACEDMWLSEETRQLLLACSSSAARAQWMPKLV